VSGGGRKRKKQREKEQKWCEGKGNGLKMKSGRVIKKNGRKGGLKTSEKKGKHRRRRLRMERGKHGGNKMGKTRKAKMIKGREKWKKNVVRTKSHRKET